MALYVLIQKKAEDASFTDYEFGPSEDRLGVLRLSKESGEISVITEVPGDSKQLYSLPAQRKILQHWQDGECPDRTCWAS